MITINPYNIDDNVNSDVCLICHDDIDSYQNYKLQECNHIYHTDCIIQWFRTGNVNCPYCNSKSENNICDSNNGGHYYNRRKIIESTYRTIKAFSKKEKAPKILKSKIKSIEKIQDQLKDIRDNIKKIKNEEGLLHDLQKKYRKYKTKLWNKQRVIYGKKYNLVGIVNIIPIIIPNKIKLFKPKPELSNKIPI
jgi:hypothetical protein